jgi:hypothetical protein
LGFEVERVQRDIEHTPAIFIRLTLKSLPNLRGLLAHIRLPLMRCYLCGFGIL